MLFAEYHQFTRDTTLTIKKYSWYVKIYLYLCMGIRCEQIHDGCR